MSKFVLMNSRISSIWQWLQRFLSLPTLACLAIVAFLMFYGDNSVKFSIEHDRTIDSLRQELQANRDTMLYYRGLNERLASDPELMEQVVREQYGMKRANEDVFVIKD